MPGRLLTGLLLLLTIGCTRQSLRFPIERTESRRARGEYLVKSAADCFGCHSEIVKEGEGSGLPIPGREGVGAVIQDETIHLSLTIPNITPDRETGAGAWTDEDLMRAITQGIGHDGRTLIPMMPYQWFRELGDEDLASIIVYIRSIPAVRNTLPKTELPNFLRGKFKPLPGRPPIPRPDLSTPQKRGEYLTHAGRCAECHTPFDMGALAYRNELEFGG